MKDQKLRNEVKELTEVVKELGIIVKKIVDIQTILNSQLQILFESNESKVLDQSKNGTNKATDKS